jgi:hypothetical protein
MGKIPSLMRNPKLVKAFDRERWFQEAFDRNGSQSAMDSRKQIVRRVDHYCKKVHEMKPEEVFIWIKKESKSQEELTQYAIDFLSQYIKFCKKDHKDIIINWGRNPKKPNKNNHLKKLHDNSIAVNIPRVRGFMSQVGGIRIHNDDMKRVPIPNTVKKGMYDDEEGEPLTSEQARMVLETSRDQRSRVLYNFLNDTAFRISEAGMVKNSDFDFSKTPASVKTPNMSIKGVKTRGERYLRDKTSHLIRNLIIDKEEEDFTFRKDNSQKLVMFRANELKKIRLVFNKLGMNQVYEETNRNKYNLHSWRKRCATEYGRANGESLADGYLRHSKYLAQYHLKTQVNQRT